MNSDWFGIGGGDGFQTAVDPTDFNIVYTESQDGNTSRYDLRGTATGRASGRRPGGGRGGRGGAAAVAAARRSRCGAVAAAGGGGAAAAGRRSARRPRRAPNVLNAARRRYRFNWNTPFMLSPHNPSIVWLGGNRLFKSLQPRRHVDRERRTSRSRSIATRSR